MSREEVLPMFRPKTVEFEYRSNKKSSTMSEDVSGVIGVGLFLVAFLIVVFVTMFLVSVIPGAMDFFGGDAFLFPQLLLTVIMFMGAFLLVRPVLMRLDKHFDNRRRESEKEDKKLLSEKLKEKGFASNLPISMKNISRIILTEEATGIDYRIMGYSQGMVNGKQNVHLRLKV